MPADATTVINAVVSALETLYPSIPVFQSKRPATEGDAGKAGWSMGLATTAFVVSSLEDEEIDEGGTFEDVSVGYKILIEYVKPAEAVVANQAGRPARVVEDSDIRDKRQEIRRTLYKPALSGISGIGNVVNRPSVIYDAGGGGKLVVSGQVFEWELHESRLDS